MPRYATLFDGVEHYATLCGTMQRDAMAALLYVFLQVFHRMFHRMIHRMLPSRCSSIRSQESCPRPCWTPVAPGDSSLLSRSQHCSRACTVPHARCILPQTRRIPSHSAACCLCAVAYCRVPSRADSRFYQQSVGDSLWGFSILTLFEGTVPHAVDSIMLLSLRLTQMHAHAHAHAHTHRHTHAHTRALVRACSLAIACIYACTHVRMHAGTHPCMF